MIEFKFSSSLLVPVLYYLRVSNIENYPDYIYTVSRLLDLEVTAYITNSVNYSLSYKDVEFHLYVEIANTGEQLKITKTGVSLHFKLNCRTLILLLFILAISYL